MRIPDRWLAPALVLLAAALLIGTAGWGDLYNETDGQYGGAAKVMAEGGSWLIPENNDVPRLVKPLLLYWLMAGSIQVFGLNEFAARLPDALGLLAWVWITYLFGARLGGPWRGFMAGAILLTSLGTFTLGRIVMPEPVFGALIAGALYCVVLGWENETRRKAWYLGFWLCAALASFTKGWHGLIYPLATVGLAALLCREGRPKLRGLLSLRGLLIFAAINLPWYFYLEHQYPGYIHNLFFKEQLGHITGTDAPATAYTDVPRWQFLALHLAWFFPWSLLAGIAWLKSRTLPALGNFVQALVLAWGVVILGSVLLTGERQDYYAMTMWPVFALGAAAVLERTRPAAIVLTVLLGLGLAAAIILPGLAPTESGAVAERSTAWNTVTNFDRGVWTSLTTTAWLALGGATFFSLLAACLRGRGVFLALVLAAACLNLGAISGTALVAPYFSLARIAPEIEGGDPAITRIFYDGDIDTGSSLLFYTGKPVVLLNQKPDQDFIVRKFHIGRDRYETTEQLAAAWKTNEPIALVTEGKRLEEWRQILGAPDLQASAHCGTQVLLKNHP